MFLYSTVSTLNPEGREIRTTCSLRSIGGNLTDCRNGGHNFSQFKLVQNGGFTRGVQPDHQDPHLLLAEETLHRSQVICIIFLETSINLLI